MSDESLRPALRAATKMRCCRGRKCLVEAGEMKPPCCMPWHEVEAAATVAAFLRAIPEWPVGRGMPSRESAARLAAAVEELAREPV